MGEDTCLYFLWQLPFPLSTLLHLAFSNGTIQPPSPSALWALWGLHTSFQIVQVRIQPEGSSFIAACLNKAVSQSAFLALQRVEGDNKQSAY